MSDNDLKKYILLQLEHIRDALLDEDEDHIPSVCFNLGVLMATIDLNTEDDEDEDYS